MVKSQKWLSSVFFTVIEDVVIVGPLKIFILSMVLSMAFQSVSEKNNQRVYAKDALRVRIPAEEEKYEAYSTNIKHPMYALLRPDAIKNRSQRKKYGTTGKL